MQVVLVEAQDADTFTVFTNADAPGKSVTAHCALFEQTVRPDWRLGIKGWLKQNGMKPSKDSILSAPDDEEF